MLPAQTPASKDDIAAIDAAALEKLQIRLPSAIFEDAEHTPPLHGVDPGSAAVRGVSRSCPILKAAR